jgi:leucyl/phenylalanyl-tRNA--protein transferase
MPLFMLPPEHLFPDPNLARDDGLLAVGGDLEPERLLLGYSQGIFPWYSEGQPILWHSPDPRFVLFLEDFSIGRSLKKTLRKGSFEIRMDTAFERVLLGCSSAARPDQDGTWITREMHKAYTRLHELGFAHSTEAWLGDDLVGGLYGVSLGGMFFGESMYAHTSDASKVAFACLATQLIRWGFDVIDSQVRTEHLERFGAREIPRAAFMGLLEDRMSQATRRGPWTLDEDITNGEVFR